VLDYAVYVTLDCVIYCAFYSILFRGPFFFPDTVYLSLARQWLKPVIATTGGRPNTAIYSKVCGFYP